jgi:hypothetical protein
VKPNALPLSTHDQVRHVLKEAALVELATSEAEEHAAINARRTGLVPGKFKSGGVTIDWSTGATAVYHDNVIPFRR